MARPPEFSSRTRAKNLETLSREAFDLLVIGGGITGAGMARVLKDERNQMLSRAETLAQEPLLRDDNLYGAGMYYEYLTDDARLVVETIKSAAALGAVIANYAVVTGLLADGGRLNAVMVK